MSHLYPEPSSHNIINALLAKCPGHSITVTISKLSWTKHMLGHHHHLPTSSIIMILWMVAKSCSILDGWNPVPNGMFTTVFNWWFGFRNILQPYIPYHLPATSSYIFQHLPASNSPCLVSVVQVQVQKLPSSLDSLGSCGEQLPTQVSTDSGCELGRSDSALTTCS